MKNGQNLRLWLWFFCLSLSSLCLSLSFLSLYLSVSLSFPFFAIYIFFEERERGGGVDTIDDAIFLTSCAVCVCGGGGEGVFVCKFSCLSCFFAMWREIMLS